MPRGKKMSLLRRKQRQRQFQPYQLFAKTKKMYSSIVDTYDALKKRLRNALHVGKNIWTSSVTKVLPRLNKTQQLLPIHVVKNTDDDLRELAFLDSFFNEAFYESPLSNWVLSEEEMEKIMESIENSNPSEEDTTTITPMYRHPIHHNIQRPSRSRRKPVRFIAEPSVSASVRQQSQTIK